MNFNFGLLPELRPKARARKRKEMKAARALDALKKWKEAEWDDA
jgi:folate-dependent tRNA-U54 methylase TrmFO/GidA